VARSAAAPLSCEAGAAAPPPLALPADVATLYAWRNGQTDSGWSLVGRTWFMPLDQLVVQRREGASAATDVDDPTWWSDDWFPVLDDGMGNLYCIEGATGRVLLYLHDDPDRQLVAPSLAGLFAALVEGMESGALACAPDEEPWVGPVVANAASWTQIRATHGIEIPLVY
jgi:cell wall assembly regulator SMI1